MEGSPQQAEAVSTLRHQPRLARGRGAQGQAEANAPSGYSIQYSNANVFSIDNICKSPAQTMPILRGPDLAQ